MTLPRSTAADAPAEPGRTATSRAARARRRGRVLLWRARHLVAALCLGAAAIVALGELRPAEPAGTPVLTLAVGRPAGAVLEPSDLLVRSLPVEAAPHGTLVAPAEAVGARLAVALPAGFPLVPGLLVGPGLAAGAPAGTVVVPVRLADPAVARLLRAGDVIDLHASPPDGTAGPSAVLARGALVLARADEEAAGLLGGPDGAPLLLLAVPPEVATLVTGAGGWTPLGAVLLAGGPGAPPASPTHPGVIP